MFQTFSANHVFFLGQAALWTLMLSSLAFLGGTVGGLLLTLLRTAPSVPLNLLARGYITAIQGTPLLVQLFLAYFGAAALGLQVPPLMAAAIAFTLYASAFLGEIWRGALQSIAKGQWECAYALGLDWPKTMLLIIVPQAVRSAVPPTVGFLVQLVKNTALASIIGYTELTRAGQIVSNATFQPLPVFMTVAVFYFSLCFPLSLASRALEARLLGRRPVPLID
ncbi:MAG: amino acid ABC transporter permease [Proteobacteria bacterium]|nr:amino acid ABC transporter permease [Pseudomonadota bacterium]MBI3499908.1 amino acid ABC transporter permease [Pseudomonadota bacterium]